MTISLSTSPSTTSLSTTSTTSPSTFISTAIPFVNAEPHLGFAYELVLADILARHRRRRGDSVHFLTGTDDHSLKNVVAAAKAGLPTRELVDRNSTAFRALGPLLDLSPDDFLATSIDPRHRPAVEQLWRACFARGDLYTREYFGRYCAGCEAFVEDDVTICEEHHVEPEPVHETNWFFRLSRYRDEIRELIESNTVRIISDSARAETLAFLAGEVRDLSVSRDATRANGWGIPVPDDPTQVIYVWFDALTNYISALGVARDRALFEKYWGSGNGPLRSTHVGSRTHVIGKGITRFHAVYWLAFLRSAGLPLPTTLAVHGYLTVDGKKISKSNNPAPVPPVVDRWGTDALRWFFARHCRTRVDSDVPRESIGDAYDRDLADRLGNLVQRTTALLEKLSTSGETGRDRKHGGDRPLHTANLSSPRTNGAGDEGDRPLHIANLSSPRTNGAGEGDRPLHIANLSSPRTNGASVEGVRPLRPTLVQPADSDRARPRTGDASDEGVDPTDWRQPILVQPSDSDSRELDGARVPASRETPDTLALRAIAEALPARVDAALAAFLPDEAASAIIELLDAANRYLETVAPWRLAKTDREAALAALYAPLEAARFAAGELEPFVPGVSRVIAKRLGDVSLAPVWGALRAGSTLRTGSPPLPKRSAR